MEDMVPDSDTPLSTSILQSDTGPTLTPVDTSLASRLVEQYEGWLKGLSDKSVKAYRSDLASLARWATEQGAPIPLDADGKPDRLAALVWLLGRGQGPAHADARLWLSTMNAATTRARRRSCLRSFADLAAEAGALPWSLKLTSRAKADKVRANPDARPSIASDLVAALWDCTTGDDPTSRRDRAVVALLVWAGLRRFEICDLDVENLDLPGGRVLVHRKHKGDQLVPVELAGPVVVALHAHVQQIGAATGPVFRSATGPTAGQRLQPDAIGGLLARLCDYCGQPRITPHALRHHGATLLARSGADTGAIQEWLGHAGPDAASSYIQAAGRRQRARAAADLIEALIPQPAIDGQTTIHEVLAGTR